ncbi:MAG TPA: hypothetical protein VGR08_02240 [Thermomicrobiales bacterium]|nr:hypothetical protein [Thermomicrobiales bacterium]
MNDPAASPTGAPPRHLPTEGAERVGTSLHDLPAPRSRLDRLERLGIIVPTTLLWVATLGLVYAFLGTDVLRGNRGLVNLTESFGALERVALWQRALQWLPGSTGDGGFFTLAPGAIAYGVRAALVLMYLAHAWSFWLVWKGNQRPFWTWLVGPIGAHLILLLMVPSNADVFFYEISGDLAANGVNPYLHPLVLFPDHPIYPYNHWVNMSTVYGPLWTTISAGLMRVAGPDPVTATVLYKLVLGAAAIGCAAVTYRLACVLTGKRSLAVAAGVLVAWQPNMLIESSGQAHNDPVLILLATCGLALVLVGGIGAIRGAVILVAASAMIKYVTLPLLGFLVLLRLVNRKTKGGSTGILGNWLVDALAIAAVIWGTFVPYWSGIETLAEMFSEPGRIFTHPLWFMPSILLENVFSPQVATVYEVVMQVALMLVLLAVLANLVYRFGRAMWSAESVGDTVENDVARDWKSTRPLLVAWTGTICALAFIPANSHPWYWTWPIVPVALLVTFDARDETASERRLPRWFWAYFGATMVLTLVYHTRIVNT